MTNKIFYLFFGAPGSGKGTQAQLLAKRIKLPIISTGEMLRQEIENATVLGTKIKKIIAHGKYVSDKIAGDLIVERLRAKDTANGAIFDGYPRTKPQQKFLIDLLEKSGHTVIAVLVDVSPGEILRRQGGRRVCINGHTFHLKFNPPSHSGICDECGKKLFLREDDRPEAVKVRLDVYAKKTEVLLEHWRELGELLVINGEQEIKLVQKDLIKILKKNKFVS